MADSQNLQAALAYARMGWKVFPLRPKLKTPLTTHGFHDASSDVEQIRRWWTASEAAGVAIATGAASGVVVIDIDPRNGGDDTLTFLESMHGELPHTIEVATGGGGRHLYFKHPGGIFPSAKPWSGIDVKSDGGYVAAPFSVHPSGLKYRWKEGCDPDCVELADLPPWVFEELEAAKTKMAERTKAAHEEQGESRVIPEGERDATLTSLAGSMQRRGMSFEAILQALLAENKARCIPQLDEVQVLKIVESVTRYVPDPDAAVGVSRDAVEGKLLKFVDVGGLKEPGEIDWLLDRRVAFGDCAMIAGPPGSRKSWVSYEIAVAGAAGLPILGLFQHDPFKVLYVDEENPAEEVHRRLWRLTKAWEVAPAQISEHLLVTAPCQGFSFRDKNWAYALMKQVEGWQPKVIIFDSLIAVSTIRDEGDAVEVRQFFHDYLYPLRDLCGSTIIVIHHSNKAAYLKERPTASAGLIRGSIDMVAAPDASLLIEASDTRSTIEAVKIRRGETPPNLVFEIVDGVGGGSRPMAEELTVGHGRNGNGNRFRAPRRASCAEIVIEYLTNQGGGPVDGATLFLWAQAADPEITRGVFRGALAELEEDGAIIVAREPKEGGGFKNRVSLALVP